MRQIDENSVIGTSYQGEITISYQALVKKFGPPGSVGDQYKIDAEWELQTPFGIATIYNWKTGRAYNGQYGSPVKFITTWHIGGHNKQVVEYIYKLWPELILNKL